jgi:large subunit ribosomal protein L25
MKLEAQKRTDASRAELRAQGRIPAVVYNREFNIPIAVDKKVFDRVFREQGTASLIELSIGGESHDVLVKSVQMDKRRREPLHADFYAVTAGQPVQVHVPIEYTGTPAGVKAGGLLDIQRREVHISILPRLIPNHLEVDVSELTVGDSLHLEAIRNKLPAEADILDDLELTLVAVVPPRVEEEPEPILEEEEPEVIGRAKEDEEGESAEGEND